MIGEPQRASAPAPAAFIELDHVAKAFDRGRIAAVRSVSLAIAEGSFVCVVGDSGSGKTTLLKTINRLIDPDAGCVRIAGTSVGEGPAHALRRRIGYVFQEVGLFPHLSVAQNIGITPRLLGWPEPRVSARIAELIGMVSLDESVLPRRPVELSGGQRQRVGVARALAAYPQIVLMDEPFGALDPVTRDTLATEYRRLHERLGLTTVMVTHDVTEAVLLSDRIIAMRAGAIVADGTPQALLADAGDEGVRALMEMPRRQAARISRLLAGKDSLG